jgi:hypothetical protein
MAPNYHMHMTAKAFLIFGYMLICLCAREAIGQPSFKDPDSLIDEMYDVLSGPPGDHDWELFRSLFHEKSIMGASVADEQGQQIYRSITPEEYIERNDGFFRTRGFYVGEIHRITEQFGDIMHLFSTYQYRLDADGLEQPAALGQNGRGINSIQLIHDAGRWWIVSIQYTNERPDLPIPRRHGG